MNRNQKSNLVSSLKSNLIGSAFVAVIHYRGMTDKQLYELRVALKSKGCNIKISKNTLIKVAIKGTQLEPLNSYLVGPSAILYSQDPVILAKIISETAKQVQVVKIIAGFFNNSLMSEATIKEMAKLGSLDEVRASFIGILNGAQSKFIRVLNAPKDGLATLKTQ
ncbi:MAG: 50S ribosomal protein L10 [Proteobacteria bacterium]|nr:50S ribosomal protein L10 [Pseudomonadota bacterium]NCA28362.1 50S ribosomal protein L10 [Pseudomonadota bacterium]